MTSDLPLAVIERQRRWEMESVNRGIERYREAQAEIASAADTEPGKRMLVDILSGLIPAIEAAQEEALQAITRLERGRWANWWLPILSLDAPKLAFITAQSAINADVRLNGKATAVAIGIANGVKLQREFELWKENEYAKERSRKEAASAGLEVPKAVNLYKLMISRVKAIDARTARKWMQKANDFDRIDWDTDTKVAFGSKLLALLVEHGGGYFEIAMIGSGMDRRRTTERRIKLTPIAEAYLSDINEQSELNRPWLLPMLAPPAPWKEAA